MLFTFTEEDTKYMHIVWLSVFLITLLGLSTWLNATEVKYLPIEIKETSNFKYYVNDDGYLVPIPNNTTSVLKKIPRPGSTNPEKYELIYE